MQTLLAETEKQSKVSSPVLSICSFHIQVSGDIQAFFFVTPSTFDICRGNDKTGAIRQIIGSLLSQETLQLTITSQVRLVGRWA